METGEGERRQGVGYRRQKGKNKRGKDEGGRQRE